MGVCASSNSGGTAGASPEVSAEELRHSKGIDKLLREDERRLAREVKVCSAKGERVRELTVSADAVAGRALERAGEMRAGR